MAKLLVEGTKLLLWDLGGQSGLRVIWERYYAEAHALIYMIDAADSSRIHESHQELGMI